MSQFAVLTPYVGLGQALGMSDTYKSFMEERSKSLEENAVDC